ncbi:hypothetical protein HII31_13583 [Pseudocercospora fuligena]|uniref:Yeast cell wall synthesis Kre9/Knh1-like N-terminal domain-containing protein n=1 Tax=Pseudocercospora fuligena TaxID=685502 RepID=A0A8H6VBB9_9PEZI|nr:hypothetical protein HII31_13583 [Pseudocercospora fuligena]
MVSDDRSWEINARVRWSRAGRRSVEGLASLENSLAVGVQGLLLQASFVAFFLHPYINYSVIRRVTRFPTALPRSKQYRESNTFESQYIALIRSIKMFFKSLLVSALAALATAQSNPLGFTKVPNPVTVGKPNVITYMTNDDTTPVTILLRRGDSNNLQTVKTLTTSATDGSYIWTPENDLDNGSDYALEIQQSGNEPNYYGPFQIQGSTESGSSSSSGSMTASSMSSTITATANISGTSTTLTATYPVSAGNMTSMSRNATMSHATLTRSSSTASQTATETTGGAGFQGTTTGASPSQTGNSASSFAAGGSAIALVFGAVAAIVMG